LTVPIVYENFDDIEKCPVFIKPDAMYGSQGVKKINSRGELSSLEINLDEYVVSEYLPGDEFSVECFSTKEKGLMYTMARSRVRVRMGTSMRSEGAGLDIQESTKTMAEVIQTQLGIDGLWFFQVKYNNQNKLSLLEIESRVAGTMAFSRAHGVNLPLANLYYADNQEVQFQKQQFHAIIDRSLVNRYSLDIEYDVVYVDLDDTIIIKNRINTDLMKFLYQCVNNQKKIILISKSTENDKIAYLKKKKIFSIFDEIIWLEEECSKSEYIKYKKSIFIDDSFSQRLEVLEKIGIPVFDAGMIEVLIQDQSE